MLNNTTDKNQTLSISMANEELKKYQESYNKFVESLVLLHNANLHFYEHPENIRDRIEVRRQIKNIRISINSMWKQTKLVYIEGKKNYREEQRRLRQVTKIKRPYRKKGKANDNNQQNPSTD